MYPFFVILMYKHILVFIAVWNIFGILERWNPVKSYLYAPLDRSKSLYDCDIIAGTVSHSVISDEPFNYFVLDTKLHAYRDIDNLNFYFERLKPEVLSVPSVTRALKSF